MLFFPEIFAFHFFQDRVNIDVLNKIIRFIKDSEFVRYVKVSKSFRSNIEISFGIPVNASLHRVNSKVAPNNRARGKGGDAFWKRAASTEKTIRPHRFCDCLTGGNHKHGIPVQRNRWRDWSTCQDRLALGQCCRASRLLFPRKDETFVLPFGI